MTRTLEERQDAHSEPNVHLWALLDLAESDIQRADELEQRALEPIRILGACRIMDVSTTEVGERSKFPRILVK
jgi:hypothetical protein